MPGDLQKVSMALLEKADDELLMRKYRFRVDLATNLYDGSRVYYVYMPFSLRKESRIDKMLDSVLGNGGRATARGISLWERLNAMDGVQPRLDEVRRHVVVINVKGNAFTTDEQLSDKSLGGLPRAVALVLQTA